MRTVPTKILMTFVLVLAMGSTLFAKAHTQSELLNIAGKQRMLSQRIAKDYFYIGLGINVSKAKRQLSSSLESFNKAQKVLNKAITDDEIKNMLMFVDMSSEDFAAITSEKYTLDNGALVLDLSESMLEGSQYVVDALKQRFKTKTTEIVDIAGRQRMLSQRIAKYYISYQAGIKDKNSITQMKEAVRLFSESHKKLMANKRNTPEINKELKKVDRLWKIVYKFYLNIEKGGLPIIVFNTTDDIMQKMDRVTKLYVDLYK
jgi:nitrate/nitrite-specific signal transduction histidine kinase